MPEIFTFINPMEKQSSEIPKGNGYQTTVISPWNKGCMSLPVHQSRGRRKISVLTMPVAHSRRWECERCCEESNGEKRSVGTVKGKSPA